MNDAFCPRGSGGGDSGLTRFDYANDNEFKIVFLIRRSLVVVCYLIVHILSKYRIQRSRESQSVSLLIMPSYVMYLLCMLVYVIITAILGYMVLDGWPLYTYVALDVGIDVFFRNSLLAFFAQPGAGRQNFRAAFTVGVGVGAAYAANTMVSAIFYSQGNLQVALIIHVAFRLCYTFFGLFLYLIPRDKFFRREAFQALMLVSVVENTCGISYSIMTRNAATYSTCYVNVMTTVVSGLLGPLTTLYCLNLDSQVSLSFAQTADNMPSVFIRTLRC